MNEAQVLQLQTDFKRLEVLVLDLVTERSNMLRTIAALVAKNTELEDQLRAETPRKIQFGDRVRANNTAGFHRGAEGTVQFVEPSYEKVWVLRDHSSGPVFYFPNELDVLLKVEDANLDKKENG